MKASRWLAENDIITRGLTVKIQQVAVCWNYENPSNNAKGESYVILYCEKKIYVIHQ
jgi:hypothetical protein